MSLPEHYRKLLAEYDRVLNLSKMILAELKRKGKESNLSSLLEKKEMAGEAITQLSKEITSVKIDNYSDSNLRTLADVRGLLKLISEKAKLLQEVEEKIQDFLKQKDTDWK